MAGVNKAIILGRLGKDPELRHSQTSGKAVCRFSVATSDRFGNGEERTEWHNVVLFDRQAEVASEYLAKGRQVYIEGRIQTRKWQDQDGKDRYTTEIIGQTMQFIGGRSEQGSDDYAPSQPRREAPPRPAPKPQTARPTPVDDDPFSGEFGPPPTEDDMPF